MTTFTQAPLALIVPSTTNPRKNFDSAKLAELTASIAAMGVRLIKGWLSVGTTRAMKILAELERDGVVSGVDGNGARKVLVAA